MTSLFLYLFLKCVMPDIYEINDFKINYHTSLLVLQWGSNQANLHQRKKWFTEKTSLLNWIRFHLEWLLWKHCIPVLKRTTHKHSEFRRPIISLASRICVGLTRALRRPQQITLIYPSHSQRRYLISDIRINFNWISRKILLLIDILTRWYKSKR